MVDFTYKTIDLFAGIGGIRLAFERHGCNNVFSSEIDKHAAKIYRDNFGEDPFGDINLISVEDIPDHDILLAGFPCQPFSIAGKGLGFADTRGTLFFNIEYILKVKRPQAFLLENVKRLLSHDGGRTFGIIKNRLLEIGYTLHYKVLDSLHYGNVPQKRERLYIVGFLENVPFSFPDALGSYRPLSDILLKDEDVDKKFFLSQMIVEKRFSRIKKIPDYPSIWHENIGGNISALPYSCALRAGGSYNYLVVNGKRRLTGREMLRLQGFPDSFRVDVPYTQIRKVAGNSVTVPVVERIAANMLRSLRKGKKV